MREVVKNKITMVFIATLLLSVTGFVFAKTQILQIHSVEVGDYCWISGDIKVGKKMMRKEFLVNTPAEKDLCSTGDSEKETERWKGKQISITTKIVEICPHIPPCEKGDRLFKTPAVIDYQLVGK